MTLKKISHLTGFSESTVSKALNDKFDISVQTKKIIQDFALKNNYVPNRNAITLRKNKSHIIAIILPQVNDVFYGETLCTMQNKASQLNYRIMLFQSFEKILKENEYLDEINDGSVDGAIVLSTRKNNNKYSKTRNIPIVHIQIVRSQSQDVLKANCMSNFENLLKQIK